MTLNELKSYIDKEDHDKELKLVTTDGTFDIWGVLDSDNETVSLQSEDF